LDIAKAANIAHGTILLRIRQAMSRLNTHNLATPGWLAANFTPMHGRKAADYHYLITLKGVVMLALHYPALDSAQVLLPYLDAFEEARTTTLLLPPPDAAKPTQQDKEELLDAFARFLDRVA
jgi:hypothetical protein